MGPTAMEGGTPVTLAESPPSWLSWRRLPISAQLAIDHVVRRAEPGKDALLVGDGNGRGVVFRGEPEHEIDDLGAALGLLTGLGRRPLRWRGDRIALVG